MSHRDVTRTGTPQRTWRRRPSCPLTCVWRAPRWAEVTSDPRPVMADFLYGIFSSLRIIPTNIIKVNVKPTFPPSKFRLQLITAGFICKEKAVFFSTGNDSSSRRARRGACSDAASRKDECPTSAAHLCTEYRKHTKETIRKGNSDKTIQMNRNRAYYRSKGRGTG